MIIGTKISERIKNQQNSSINNQINYKQKQKTTRNRIKQKQYKQQNQKAK